MNAVKKIVKYIRDIVEVYIPSLVFLIMFSVFILQIFFRYILNNPLAWTMEVTLICFCWLVILGACYAARKKTHVTFTLIYDSVSHTKKHLLSIFGNLILIAAFILILKPSIDFIKFMSFQGTSVLKINMSFVFAPFAVLVFEVIIYQVIELFESVLSIKKGKDVSLLDRETETELTKLIVQKLQDKKNKKRAAQ